MTAIDYFVLLFYVFGVFAVGVGLSAKVSSTSDLFKAGGRSPWWASGLSSFMTMFSAGTFVVWGGIAYRLGLVAVMINLCYGVAALLVGWFVAGRWKQLGIETPAEFVEQRYGTGVLHFYTWLMMLYRMVGTGVALYSLAILLINLMPLPDGNPFRDAATGNLSLTWAVLLFGGCVVIYTMVGGLWAVLMTDVLQFIILNLAVLFMIPLILGQVGGFGGFVSQAPDGFFLPIAGPYTWFFLAGWCAIHFFMVGAEWAFVQRFICVPTAQDARKSAYLFGALYLISPVLWLAPPLAYRVIQPIPDGATEAQITQLSESAYIMTCKHVLPVGMLGLMLAAMFSATASMVSSQLNVFAGVMTEDVYRKMTKDPSDRHLLWVGRGLSLLLGAVLVGLALAVPLLGGAEKVIIAVTSLMVTPLLSPTIFGLFSPRMTQKAVWVTALVCFVVGAVALGLPTTIAEFLVQFPAVPETLTDMLAGLSLAEQLKPLGKATEVLVGVVLPVLVLVGIWATSKGVAPGWTRVVELANRRTATAAATGVAADHTPGYIVAGALVLCSLLMAALVFFNENHRLLILLFAAVLAGIGGGILWITRRARNKNLREPTEASHV